jgi:hypothetical protein
MAFGAGVLMAVLSVLMEDDWHAGGFVAAAGGFRGRGVVQYGQLAACPARRAFAKSESFMGCLLFSDGQTLIADKSCCKVTSTSKAVSYRQVTEPLTFIPRSAPIIQKGGIDMFLKVNMLLAVVLFILLAVAPFTHAQQEMSKQGETQLSLITATPEEGFQLAIKLARKGVTETQPDKEVLHKLRPAYAHDPDSLIAASQVVAIHFQTIAAANNYWRN